MAVDLIKPLKIPAGAFSRAYSRGLGLGEVMNVYFITATGGISRPLQIDGHHVVKLRIPPGFVKVYDSPYSIEYARLSQCEWTQGYRTPDRGNADRIQINTMY